MSLQKRIENLETRHAGPTRYFIASQDYDNENLFHVSQSGHDESETMTSDELTERYKNSPDVTIIKVVFENIF